MSRNRVWAAPVNPLTGRRAERLMAFAAEGAAKSLDTIETCASFKTPVSVRRRGALTKTGWIATGDRRRQIAGSRIRHDGSNCSVELLRRAERLRQELAQWTRLTQKCSLLGQRTDCLNDNREALSEGGIDGYCRGAGTTILFSAWVLRKTVERVSLVYRNDDGVHTKTVLLIHRAGQRKRGHIVCPRFASHRRKMQLQT